VVEAEHFDAGGEGVAYHDVDPWNIGGDGSRPGEGVDIETDGEVTDVCYVRAGEYLEYSVDADAAGSYALTLRAANPDAGAKAVKVYLDGVPAGEVLVGGTGSWTVFGDFTGPARLAIPTGRHVVTLAFEGVERVNLDRLAFTVAAPTGTPTPTATETPAPTANVTTTVIPTAPETGTFTPTPTVTATGPTPDATPTAGATPTVEVTPPATATETPEPSPTAEATPSVTGTPPPVPVPVPSAAGAPLDPDGDGAYEDVNGNGRADFADVALLFEALAWCAEHEPAAVFDFNANGRIDFADVVALFDGL
jgi:PKD repeat protein